MYMKKTARQLLAANLKTLMGSHPDLDTQTKVAAKAQKIGGEKIAQTTVSNLINPAVPYSPNLSTIEAIAAVFGLQAWQLLHPTLGDQKAEAAILASFAAAPERAKSIVYQLLEMDAVPDYQVGKHLPPAPSTKPAKPK